MKREVPQEHSHEVFLTAVGTALNLNNPNKFGDPVFGLLGAAVRIQLEPFMLLAVMILMCCCRLLSKELVPSPTQIVFNRR